MNGITDGCITTWNVQSGDHAWRVSSKKKSFWGVVDARSLGAFLGEATGGIAYI